MSIALPGFGAAVRREPARRTRLLATPAFDWIYLILIVLCEVGFALDIFSHVMYGPDQSVLSEYHLLMYGSIAVLGAFLTFVGASRLREGASWRNALPAGYGIGFVGITAFLVSAVVDLTGHALFGFETGVESLLSPSHLGLFLGLGLLRLALPLAAGARQRAGIRQRWVDYLPAMVSLAMFFQLLSGMLPDPPLGRNVAAWPTQAMRLLGDNVGYTIGIGGIFMLTAAFVGLVVGVRRVVELPFGSITLISVGSYLLQTLGQSDLQAILIWSATGIAGDLLLAAGDRWLKNDTWTLRLFGLAVPLVLWGAFFGSLILTNAGGGVWWSGYVWTGTAAQAAVVGFMVAVLATLPGMAPATEAAR